MGYNKQHLLIDILVVLFGICVFTMPVIASDYILPDSDSRVYTEDEITNMPYQVMRYAKNEIYARHGFIFSSEELKDYFNQQDWYEGTTFGSDFDESVLNDYEKKNIELLAEVEANRYTLDQDNYSYNVVYDYMNNDNKTMTTMTDSADTRVNNIFTKNDMPFGDTMQDVGNEYLSISYVDDYGWNIIEIPDEYTVNGTYNVRIDLMHGSCFSDYKSGELIGQYKLIYDNMEVGRYILSKPKLDDELEEIANKANLTYFWLHNYTGLNNSYKNDALYLVPVEQEKPLANSFYFKITFSDGALSLGAPHGFDGYLWFDMTKMFSEISLGDYTVTVSIVHDADGDLQLSYTGIDFDEDYSILNSDTFTEYHLPQMVINTLNDAPYTQERLNG